jgi:hypothetical protein
VRPRQASNRGCTSARLLCLALAAVLWPATLLAAPEIFTLTVPNCAPSGGNSVIALSTTPESGWSSVRTYFRKAGSTDFYYVEMRSAGLGKYWAALPRPEDATAVVEVQMAVRDAEGKETRAALQKLPVTTSCPLILTPEQDRFAQNLVVGETVRSQAGQVVEGFRCDGVISRIEANGSLKPDESCRRVLMAEAAQAADEENRRKVIPLIILGAGGVALVTHKEPPEASPPRP